MMPPRLRRDTVRGRVIYLLLLVILLHFIYPLTIGGNPAASIAYQLVYTLLFGAGIFVASRDRREMIWTICIAAFWLIASILYALDPTSFWKIQSTYAFLFLFQATIIVVLLRYIFRSEMITRDVLYAAVTVYILLAAVFVPVYGFIEGLAPGAFLDNATGQPVFWQQLIYFSFVTLTTAGYGDIVPVNPWARGLANMEAVIGVLYLAILMARLVSLYSAATPKKPAL